MLNAALQVAASELEPTPEQLQRAKWRVMRAFQLVGDMITCPKCRQDRGELLSAPIDELALCQPHFDGTFCREVA